MGRRPWTADEKAAASLAAKERMAKKWMEGRNKIVTGSPFDRPEVAEAARGLLDAAGVGGDEVLEQGTKVEWSAGISEAPHAVVAILEPEVTVQAIDPPIAPPVRDPGRVGSREVVLRVKTDGLLVSLQGPCVCGARKREWHQICLKQQS